VAEAITRRKFLKAGAMGALVLATARLGWIEPAAEEADGTAPIPMLGAGARKVLGAIVPVMLAGALPIDPTSRSERVTATVAGVDRAIAGLPSHAQADLHDLFVLLAFAPSRWLLAGVRRPWGESSADEVAAFLQRWRASGWTLKQQAYLALHELVFAAFYADPASWPAIGYPGPPHLVETR
jgi:hypothetical protein